MNASAHDSVDAANEASKEAASDFRRRSGNVRDYAGEELRAFLSDVEELIKRVGNVADADVARVRGRVAGALGAAQRIAGESADTLRARAQAAAGQADEYVHERPWTAIGLAAAIGLIIGVGITAVSTRR